MTITLTFDFNCIISLENNDEFSTHLQKLIELHDRDLVNISVPAISASEKLPNGEYVDNIQKFIDRVSKLSTRRFEILKPMLIFDMTYWDYCIWADDAMIELEKDIRLILFPNFPKSYAEYAKKQNINPEILVPKWRNSECDVVSLWCHIIYQHDVFVTNDNNFHRQLKKEKLLKLGSKKIIRPLEALNDLGYENY